MLKYVLESAARVNYYGISAFVSPILLETASELYFTEYTTIPRKILGRFQWKTVNLFELANLLHTLLLQRLAGSAQVSGVNFTIVCCFQIHRSSRPLQLTGLMFYFCRCLKLHVGSGKKYSIYLCAPALWHFMSYWGCVAGFIYFHFFIV